MTVVARDTFTSAKPVGRAVVAVNQQELASAPVSRRAEVAPTRNSVFGNSAPAGNRVPHPSEEVVNRSVVAKRPPPPPPVPFERQQQKLAAQPGQPLARTEVEGLRPTNAPAVQPHVRQAPPGKATAADSNQPARQPGNVPPNAPPASVGATPPVNNVPPARNDRPNGPNRGQSGNVPPSNPPPANVGANPPANGVPPARNDRRMVRTEASPATCRRQIRPPRTWGESSGE